MFISKDFFFVNSENRENGENALVDSHNCGGNPQSSDKFSKVFTYYVGVEVGGDSNISDGVLVSGEGGYALLHITQDLLYTYKH